MMKARLAILLVLAVVTIANAGCCRTCRNWLQRGSLCGTTTAAPATMGTPVALGTPMVQPQFVQPQMAAPMQQVVMPQANCQCAPQCVPMCQPCCDPCANMCSPCGPSTWSGGYMDSGCCGDVSTGTTYDSGATVVPGTSQPTLPPGTTFAPQGTSITDPGPAPNSVNFPSSVKPAN
jgi:hypothetical protein